MNSSLLVLVPPGVMAMAWAIYGFPAHKIGVGLITLSLVTILFSAYLRIELPRAKMHLTISDALVFLSLLFYGGQVAVILAMLEAGFSSLYISPKKPRSGFAAKKTILTNVLIAAFSTFVTSLVIEIFFGSADEVLKSENTTEFLSLLAVMAFTQFAANTLLASAYIAAKTDRKLFDVWGESCFNALVLFCSGAVVAGLSAKALKQIDMVQFVLAVGFFGLVYMTYKRYNDDVRRSASQVEHSEDVRAEQAEAHIVELKHFVDELTKTAEELGESRERFRHAAYHDALTGLPNRTYIVELLDELLKDGNSGSQVDFAVLLLNLNRFRTINDSLGHQTGDRIIRHAAKRLSEVPHDGAIVGHFGGDEYAIILPGVHKPEIITDFAAAAARSIAEPIRFKGRQVYTSVSIGVVPDASGYRKAEDILRNADLALNSAKDNKKSWVIFDKSMHSQAVSMQQLETDLRYAIVCNELETFYQPIVDIDTLTLSGFEALVRWNHPNRGFILPNDFIPMSEDTGLVIPMTLQILRTACSQIVEWQNASPENKHLTVSVNLSGKHFSDPGLVDQIRKILKETAITPECLKLEITESATMEDTEKTIEKLKEIRTTGVKLSIDDFGTGYSSLSYLHRFPIDTLKIDQSFVSSMDEATENDEIVRTIMALAKSLNLNVIAEGIETTEQLSHLRHLGCEYGQGYLFSRPVPAAEIAVMLEDPTRWQNFLSESILVKPQQNDHTESTFTN